MSGNPDSESSPSHNHLAELHAEKAAIIKRGQDLVHELDRVMAKITQHQANRSDAAARWNARYDGQGVPGVDALSI